MPAWSFEPSVFVGSLLMAGAYLAGRYIPGRDRDAVPGPGLAARRSERQVSAECAHGPASAADARDAAPAAGRDSGLDASTAVAKLRPGVAGASELSASDAVPVRTDHSRGAGRLLRVPGG